MIKPYIPYPVFTILSVLTMVVKSPQLMSPFYYFCHCWSGYLTFYRLKHKAMIKHSVYTILVLFLSFKLDNFKYIYTSISENRRKYMGHHDVSAHKHTTTPVKI